MLKINVPTETYTETSRASYTFYEQEAWIVFKDADGKDQIHPEKIVIQLRADKDNKVTPHKVGDYILSPRSFYKTRFNQLALGTLVLHPVTAALKNVA